MLGQRIMKVNEFEKKILVNKEIYDNFYRCFAARGTSRMHVNYYYDTPNCYFRNRHITCRVRQKEHELVGELKRHAMRGNAEKNLEETFSIKELPLSFEAENQKVFLQGNLVTERTEISICKGIELMLDKNTYLGLTDYEIEIEFCEDKENMAEGIMLFLEKWTGFKRSEAIAKSKMNRFFSALDQMRGSSNSRIKYVSYDPDAYILSDISTREEMSNGRT